LKGEQSGIVDALAAFVELERAILLT